MFSMLTGGFLILTLIFLEFVETPQKGFQTASRPMIIWFAGTRVENAFKLPRLQQLLFTFFLC